MLFNSYIFLFGFLPVAFLAFYASGRHRLLAKLVLTFLSLAFYAWWQPRYLIILAGSIVFNFVIGAIIQKNYQEKRKGAVTTWLTIGVVADVALLGWFKYANFLVENLNAVGFDIHLARIALPLAISFFTFQKIAYLIDSARGEAKSMKLIDFALFASFFPQLIAGPITHYKEIVPQFRDPRFGRLIWQNVLVGLVIFSIGLFKKTVIADTVAQLANPLFDNAAHSTNLNFLIGWLAAITYTCQLYFDFSGYSDMAIGLGRMFGILLPLNFHSPLRSRNIAEYWRRWHMTLQRFLFAYIFMPLTIPLGRFAAAKKMSQWPAFAVSAALPLFTTFLISGIWHGAGWTFVLYGLMHAIFMTVQRFWHARQMERRRAFRKLNKAVPEPSRLGIVASHALTLVAVMFANVVFRATTIAQAITVTRGMAGLDHASTTAAQFAIFNPAFVIFLVVAILIIFLMPNTQQIMRRFNPALGWPEWKDVGNAPLSWSWAPSPAGLAFAATALFLGVLFVERGQEIFIYFNF